MPSEPGYKADVDDGKYRLHEILFTYFPRALQSVAAVSAFGAKKYCVGGWKTVPNGHSRYTDAMLRHYLAECMGEAYDADSTLHHDAHIAWNALARIELRLREEEGVDKNSNNEYKYVHVHGFPM